VAGNGLVSISLLHIYSFADRYFCTDFTQLKELSSSIKHWTTDTRYASLTFDYGGFDAVLLEELHGTYGGLTERTYGGVTHGVSSGGYTSYIGASYDPQSRHQHLRLSRIILDAKTHFNTLSPGACLAPSSQRIIGESLQCTDRRLVLRLYYSCVVNRGLSSCGLHEGFWDCKHTAINMVWLRKRYLVCLLKFMRK
jgi:hypothetical protein